MALTIVVLNDAGVELGRFELPLEPAPRQEETVLPEPVVASAEETAPAEEIVSAGTAEEESIAMPEEPAVEVAAEEQSAEEASPEAAAPSEEAVATTEEESVAAVADEVPAPSEEAKEQA